MSSACHLQCNMMQLQMVHTCACYIYIYICVNINTKRKKKNRNICRNINKELFTICPLADTSLKAANRVAKAGQADRIDICWQYRIA